MPLASPETGLRAFRNFVAERKLKALRRATVGRCRSVPAASLTNPPKRLAINRG